MTGALVAVSLTPVEASSTANLTIDNQSVKYAFVTAIGVKNNIGGKIVTGVENKANAVTTALDLGHVGTDQAQGSWCIPPGTVSKHALESTTLHTIKIELKNTNCTAVAKIVDFYDKAVAFPGADGKTGILTITGGGIKTIGKAPQNLPGGGPTTEHNEPGGPEVEYETIPYAITASTSTP
jgi:hypothetical protein